MKTKQKYFLSLFSAFAFITLIYSCRQQFQGFGGSFKGNILVNNQQENSKLYLTADEKKIESNQVFTDSVVKLTQQIHKGQRNQTQSMSNFSPINELHKKQDDFKLKSIKKIISENVNNYRKKYHKLSTNVRIGLYTAAISGLICLILIFAASLPGSTLTSASGNGCTYVLMILFSGGLTIWGLIYALVHALMGK
jgi:hypothetical protein